MCRPLREGAQEGNRRRSEPLVRPQCGNACAWGPAITWETGGRKWEGPDHSAQTERQGFQGQLLRWGSRTHRPKPMVKGRPQPRLLAPERAGSSQWSLRLAAAATTRATSPASTFARAARTWHGLESAVLGTGRPQDQAHRDQYGSWFWWHGSRDKGVLGRPLRRGLGVCAACGRLRC